VIAIARTLTRTVYATAEVAALGRHARAGGYSVQFCALAIDWFGMTERQPATRGE
jgi:hypothetical protein